MRLWLLSCLRCWKQCLQTSRHVPESNFASKSFDLCNYVIGPGLGAHSFASSISNVVLAHRVEGYNEFAPKANHGPAPKDVFLRIACLNIHSYEHDRKYDTHSTNCRSYSQFPFQTHHKLSIMNCASGDFSRMLEMRYSILASSCHY